MAEAANTAAPAAAMATPAAPAIESIAAAIEQKDPPDERVSRQQAFRDVEAGQPPPPLPQGSQLGRYAPEWQRHPAPQHSQAPQFPPPQNQYIKQPVPPPGHPDQWRRKYQRAYTEPPVDYDDEERRKPRRNRHGKRARSHSRERHGLRERNEPHNTKTRDTFIGAGGGALVGNMVVPGIGAMGGALLGGLGGREYGKHMRTPRSRSAGAAYKRNRKNRKDDEG